MWSRRAACESITTRRRRFGVPLLAAPSPALDPSAPFGAEGFVPAALGASSACAGAFSAAGLVAVAVAEAPSPEPFSAASASDSSTLDGAALASTPAALSLARSSLLVRPWAFAISCTRFFATTRPPSPRSRSRARPHPRKPRARLHPRRPQEPWHRQWRMPPRRTPPQPALPQKAPLQPRR